MKGPIKLVCVANPSAYASSISGVPSVHERMAKDPRFELYHLPSDELHELDLLPTRRVPPSFVAADFAYLDELPVTALASTQVDLALCRTLKPFAPDYMRRLSALGARVPFVNAPAGITRHLDLDFAWSVIAPHAPEGLVVHTLEQGEAFARAHPSFVVKRGNSCGGKGIYRVDRSGEQLLVEGLKLAPERVAGVSGLLERLRLSAGDPLLFMRYLPRVNEGDLRVFVLGKEIIGAMLRKNPRSWIQNLSSGGAAFEHPVPDELRGVIAATAATYTKLGVLMLGYDFLRDDDGRWRLSELNAGNIGGYVALERAGGAPMVRRLLDALASAAIRAMQRDDRQRPYRASSAE